MSTIIEKSASRSKATAQILLKPRQEIFQKLTEQIEFGEKNLIVNKNISDLILLEKMRKEKKWSRYNQEYLASRFNTNNVAEDYKATRTGSILYPKSQTEIDRFNEKINNQICFLESIRDSLELYEEFESSSFNLPSSASATNVFIVHGHDNLKKQKLLHFLTTLGLNGIILSDQPNQGQTLIEKFENNASEARYAIILLTADDIGYAKVDSANPKARARQNVILELGYFLAKLGRRHVCCLIEEEIEIPSDYHGVSYIPTKDEGTWQLKLAQEMKTAGLLVDLNKLIKP